MSILSDIEIEELCLGPQQMITPFVNQLVRVNEAGEKIISYGLSSYGYDIRVAPEFKIFTNINSTIVDAKDFDHNSYVDFKGDVCIMPPNSIVLGRTVEKFNMPPDVTGVCVGKSTYARVGIFPLVTPIECSWTGYLTLEFANLTPLPAKLYANEGGCQIQFFRGNPCRTTYKDRNGKYQHQLPQIVTARV